MRSISIFRLKRAFKNVIKDFETQVLFVPGPEDSEEPTTHENPEPGPVLVYERDARLKSLEALVGELALKMQEYKQLEEQEKEMDKKSMERLEETHFNLQTTPIQFADKKHQIERVIKSKDFVNSMLGLGVKSDHEEFEKDLERNLELFIESAKRTETYKKSLKAQLEEIKKVEKSKLTNMNSLDRLLQEYS